MVRGMVRQGPVLKKRANPATWEGSACANILSSRKLVIIYSVFSFFASMNPIAPTAMAKAKTKVSTMAMLTDFTSSTQQGSTSKCRKIAAGKSHSHLPSRSHH